MNSQDNRLNERLKFRESLTKEILADIEYEVDDLLASAPDNLTEKDRKAIRNEVIAQTRRVTDALTTEELQNEGARGVHLPGGGGRSISGPCSDGAGKEGLIPAYHIRSAPLSDKTAAV